MDLLIMNDNYYLTNIDIWLLAKRYNIPIIMYSATLLTENDSILKVFNKSETNSYYFIKSPGFQRNVVPKYRLLMLSDKNIKISLDNLSYKLQEFIKKRLEDDSLTSYLIKIKDNIANIGTSDLKVKKEKNKLVLDVNQ